MSVSAWGKGCMHYHPIKNTDHLHFNLPSFTSGLHLSLWTMCPLIQVWEDDQCVHQWTVADGLIDRWTCRVGVEVRASFSRAAGGSSVPVSPSLPRVLIDAQVRESGRKLLSAEPWGGPSRFDWQVRERGAQQLPGEPYPVAIGSRKGRRCLLGSPLRARFQLLRWQSRDGQTIEFMAHTGHEKTSQISLF